MSRISATLAVLAAFAPAAAGAGVPVYPGAGNRLVGTYSVQVQIEDCTSGAALGPAFLSLLTFNEGGTFTEMTSSPAFFPAIRGPGHGVWGYLGGGRFTAAQEALITVNGALTTIQQIRYVLAFDATHGEWKTTSANVSFFKPDGTPTAQGCAAATGTRFR